METQKSFSFDHKMNHWLDQGLEWIKSGFEKSFLGDYINPFVLTLLLIPFFISLTYILSVLFRFIFLRYFLKILKKKVRNEQDQALVNRLPKLIFPLFILIGLRVSVASVESYYQKDFFFLTAPLTALLIVVITIFFKRILTIALSIWGKQISDKTNQFTKQLLPLVVGASKVIILSFGFLFALSAIGVNIAPIVASLGALGFAVGFAVKDSLSNFVAGVLLILDDTFNVGDKISVPGIGFGYIHEVGLRTIRIRTFNNEIIVVPNNMLMNKEYKNYSLPDETIRVVVEFSVAYGSDVNKVKKVILDILKKDPDILKEPPPVVEFLSMADFCLSFCAKGNVSRFSLAYDKKILLTEKIYERLNREKIDIPFPTHTVHIKKNS